MAEEIGHLHPWNHDGALEGHEQPAPCALVRLQLQQVLAGQIDAALGNFVTRVPHDGEAQCALARAVGTHQRVDFAAADFQIHAAKNRLAGNVDVKIANPQRFVHVGLTFWW